LIDWGTEGMEDWMENHECNDICETLNMQKDDALIAKLKTYIEKFKDNTIQNIIFDLNIITGE